MALTQSLVFFNRNNYFDPNQIRNFDFFRTLTASTWRPSTPSIPQLDRPRWKLTPTLTWLPPTRKVCIRKFTKDSRWYPRMSAQQKLPHLVHTWNTRFLKNFWKLSKNPIFKVSPMSPTIFEFPIVMAGKRVFCSACSTRSENQKSGSVDSISWLTNELELIKNRTQLVG